LTARAARRQVDGRWPRRAGASPSRRRGRAWSHHRGGPRRRTCCPRPGGSPDREPPASRDSPTPAPASGAVRRLAHFPEDGEHAVQVVGGPEQRVRRRLDVAAHAVVTGRRDQLVRGTTFEERDAGGPVPPPQPRGRPVPPPRPPPPARTP